MSCLQAFLLLYSAKIRRQEQTVPEAGGDLKERKIVKAHSAECRTPCPVCFWEKWWRKRLLCRPGVVLQKWDHLHGQSLFWRERGKEDSQRTGGISSLQLACHSWVSALLCSPASQFLGVDTFPTRCLRSVSIEKGALMCLN